ncbi:MULTISPECIES: DMT family transporter [Pseudomonas]|uniref:DMT family transporter n=1 Tax=Pseudomonas TaxID=286 RepID=UPI001619BF99|nr:MULTISPECIES: DMT family transporter [unclassified Pseudomonas]MBB4819161.1 drug/metabolite transporter (DMT)-like permease [Pseudomonas alcaligenes]MCU9948809.1 DMT family transporter [Pseudomonas sp. PDM13]MDU9416802.1 DMT family transporter [Pseudomonas sp. zfem005]WCD82483.1 DMT family transporter [Pseudomonas sp. TUM22785]
MKPADLVRLLSLAAIWGASFLFMRVLVPVIGALPTAFFRVAISAIGLVAILALLRVTWDFRGKLGKILLIGVVSSGIPAAMYALAAEVLPAGYSAIFNATTPLMGVLIGGLFFGEKLTLPKAAGVLLGLAGVAVLTGAGPVAFDADLLRGALACLMATTCYGFAGFFTQRWINDAGGLDSGLSAFGAQAGATLCLLPIFLASSHAMPLAPLAEPGIWLALAGLGLLCTSFAYVIYFRLIANVGPVKTMTVTFLIPLFGVFWGALLLDESLSWAHLQGGVLIALALWLVLRPAVAAVKVEQAS